MPQNGSKPMFRQSMPLQDHQALATQLLAIRRAMLAAADVLEEAYGKSDGKARLLQRTMALLDTLRGHCSHALVHEHATATAPRALGEVYYPRERGR